MRDEISHWKKRINECPLPILKSTAQYFSRQKLRPGTSITSLWQCLQYDPGMCLNLLKAAGKSKTTRVSTVNHAILLLGLPNTLNRVDNLPKVEEIKKVEVRNQILQLFSNAHHALSQSDQWQRFHQQGINEEIQTASLNAGFIDYLICISDPQRYLKLIKTERQGIARDEAERKVLGVLRRELAFEIANDWRLPELIIDSQKHGKKRSTIIKHVYLSQRLIEEFEKGWYHESMVELLREAAGLFNQPLEGFVANTHRQAAIVSRNSNQIYFPAVSVASKLLQYQSTNSADNTVPIKPVKTRKEILDTVMNTIESSANLNYEEILNHVFHGIHNGLGLKRIFFALITEDKHHLKVKYAIDVQGKEGLNRFRTPLNQNNLFEQLMRQPGGVWMNDSNQKKLRPFLPKIFVEEIRSQSFFAMSVFIADKPIGMMFADTPKTGNLSEIQFKYFKHLCRLATDALEALSNNQEKPKMAQA